MVRRQRERLMSHGRESTVGIQTTRAHPPSKGLPSTRQPPPGAVRLVGLKLDMGFFFACSLVGLDGPTLTCRLLSFLLALLLNKQPHLSLAASEIYGTASGTGGICGLDKAQAKSPCCRVCINPSSSKQAQQGRNSKVVPVEDKRDVGKTKGRNRGG